MKNTLFTIIENKNRRFNYFNSNLHELKDLKKAIFIHFRKNKTEDEYELGLIDGYMMLLDELIKHKLDLDI